MTPFIVALVVAAALTPLVIAGLHRWNLIDVPNHRSSHERPVPRGGGLAVAVATVVGLVAAGEWSRSATVLVVGALVLAVVGLLDDLSDLPAWPRLAVQLAAPLIGGLLVTERTGMAVVVGLVVAVVAVAGYVNAFNFMDGINGISSTQAAVAGVFLALLARDGGHAVAEVAGWAIAGASIGFMPFNVPRARTFLGDVGSYFMGFWLAATALVLVDAGWSALVVVAPFLLYLADTSSTLVRRARRGERLTEAHREHTYQRLTQLGWSHVTVSAVCAVIAGVCSAIMYVARDSVVGLRVGALVACLVVVAGYLVLPDAIARNRAGIEAVS